MALASQVLCRSPLQNLGSPELPDLFALIKPSQKVFIEPDLNGLHCRTLADISKGIKGSFVALPAEIPGVHGCTPQSCAFRDHHADLRNLGAAVYREAVERLHLPFELPSDERFEWINALTLPTFEFGRNPLREADHTLIVRDGVIEKAFYPVFPPDGNAEVVACWLREHPAC